MMTVRFASGYSVTYNEANFAQRFTSYTDIYTKKDGSWIAQVPNDALIELVRPCKAGGGSVPTTKEALELLLNRVHEVNGWTEEARLLGKVKAALRGYNTRRRRWNGAH